MKSGTSDSKTRTDGLCHASMMSTQTTSALMQRQIDRKHFKDITAQLQMLVEKKKSLETKNRFLKQERDTMERERAKRFAQFTQSYEEKLNKITLEKDILKQEIESLQRQIRDYASNQRNNETKLTQMIKEKEQYESQLEEVQKSLVSKQCTIENFQAQIDRQNREKNKLKEEISSYRSQNTTLIIEKSELEKKVKTENKTLQEHTLELEQLRARLAENVELQVAKLAEQRLKFGQEKEKLQKEFEKKRVSYRNKLTEEYNNEKTEWMKVFKAEVETKFRTLNETNQNLEHNVTVLEDQNDEYKVALEKLKRDKDAIKKKSEQDLLEVRQQFKEQCREMESKYTTELSASRRIKVRHQQEKQSLEQKLGQLHKNSKRKLEELEKNSRRQQRENEKMKQLLIKKDNKLIMLEKEHVDYFQEINTLQRVLASAEDTPIGEDDSFMGTGQPSKKRRLSTKV